MKHTLRMYIGELLFMTVSDSLTGFSARALEFVDAHDPILDQKSRRLSVEEIQSSKMQVLFDQMLRLARGEQGDLTKSVLVGLAAPQIGVSIRVILADVKANGKGGVADLRLYINPELTEISRESEEWYEGCYSTGDIKGIVNRPNKVTVHALTREGKEVIETHHGYVARIFQHEIDHLDGIRFPARMDKNSHVHIVRSHEMAQYRNEQGWRNWKAIAPMKQWKDHVGIKNPEFN